MNRKNRGLDSDITVAVIRGFVTALAIYIVAMVLIFVAAGVVLRLFTWYPEDILYRFFKSIENNAPVFLTLCGVPGFAVIFLYYWRKTLGFISTIVDASRGLVEPDDNPIELPDELKQVETRMNQAKRDVRRNAQLAREAEQRKNELIVYLAHDIRTPLTSVIGYLSLLDEAPDMPAEQRAKYVHITLDKAYRLESLVNEFFEITRYNLQTIALDKKDVDLYLMLAQMTDEFYPELASSGKTAALNIPEDMRVFGDADKLARVFNNILKNAVTYGDDGSVIEISARENSVSSVVEFRNAGHIPQEKLASIFEKFFRLDEARSTDKGGAGLGLAIAKEIVVLHGGTINASSGGGYTVFTVTLPKG